MSSPAKRWLWRSIRTVVVLAILAGVGWTLYRNLEQLDVRSLEWEPAWLLLAAAFYLLGLFPCALFWWWALRSLGQRPGFLAAVRAYYISHLGKYVPGKALVPIVRTALIAGPEVGVSLAVFSVFYETLTVMAAGAIFAALLAGWWLPPESQQLGSILLIVSVAGLIASPWLFNPVMDWLRSRLWRAGAEPWPRIRVGTLMGGLVLGAVSWLLLGLSLWATTQSVHEQSLDLTVLLDYIGYICLATVAGFVTPAPGGLGVREWILMELLGPSIGPGPAGIVAILLRVTWIVAELATAGVLYVWPMVFSKKRMQEEKE